MISTIHIPRKDFLFLDDLSTYDPYDIWKTEIGLKIKDIFYKNRALGILPAALLTLYDHFINNNLRLGYSRQEYPMVRALAALTLLTLYSKEKNRVLLDKAESHITTLVDISSKGYNGFCCGMNAPWVSKNGRYPAATPYSTNTPYALEAIIKFSKLADTRRYAPLITSVFEFLEQDLRALKNDSSSLALSYAPVDEPRIVINANSYSMFMYALLLEFLPAHRHSIVDRIERLYRFIVANQSNDGSWYYYADSSRGNFIDCFHSCFVLKNILKTNRIHKLDGSIDVVNKGYGFIKNSLFDETTRLFLRFADTDKPSLVKFDLYDNAEMLALAVLLDDMNTATKLAKSIESNFIIGSDIFSIIDCFGCRRNSNMLRWAVMPYLYALSEYYIHAHN